MWEKETIDVVLTALPQLKSTSLAEILAEVMLLKFLRESLSLLRTMTTRAISMKKIIVVIRAARSPAPRVIIENNLDAPLGVQWIIPSDVNKAKKAKPHAIGWRTRAAVRARHIKILSSSSPLMNFIQW